MAFERTNSSINEMVKLNLADMILDRGREEVLVVL